MNEMRKPCILPFFTASDQRGCLTAIEGAGDVPFEVKRVFYLHHVQANRGGHAHIVGDQVIVAMHGSLTVELYDGQQWTSYLLDDCTKGLLVPRLHYNNLVNFSPDAVAMVLTSTHFDADDYLLLDEFEQYLAEHGHGQQEASTPTK